MSSNSQALSTPEAEPRQPAWFRFGPLCYRLQPHDSWGETMVTNLECSLQPTAQPATATRTIHLCRQTGGNPRAAVNKPPALTRQLAPGAAPNAMAWHSMRNRTGCTWHSATTADAFWSDGAARELGNFSFQLPWNLLIADIAAVGGGLMHGGLAVHRGRAVLFLAPPGGGKTTTLATAPADWSVLSDDAALVWPQGEKWLASPLPSWSTMTAMTSYSRLFDPAPVQPLSALVILGKGPQLRLTSVPAKTAAATVYRGLTEYPATVFAGLPLTEHLFRMACAIARTLPCWRLELPLGGDCWPLLVEGMATCP